MKLLIEIEKPLLHCKVYEVLDNIYAVLVEDKYDRAMLFCRYQEFYESAFDEIRGKPFDLMYYMKVYKNHKDMKTFTYPKDWTGYNIPSYALEKCLNNVFGNYPYYDICGVNGYDYIMREIHTNLDNSNNSNKPFYLLGVDSLNSSIMNHEIAHGLYYTNEDYKFDSLKLVNDLPQNIYDEMKSFLLEMGYCEDVIPDEIQAYLSTGIIELMYPIEGINDHKVVFEELFNKYKNN